MLTYRATSSRSHSSLFLRASSWSGSRAFVFCRHMGSSSRPLYGPKKEVLSVDELAKRATVRKAVDEKLSSLLSGLKLGGMHSNINKSEVDSSKHDAGSAKSSRPRKPSRQSKLRRPNDSTNALSADSTLPGTQHTKATKKDDENQEEPTSRRTTIATHTTGDGMAAARDALEGGALTNVVPVTNEDASEMGTISQHADSRNSSTETNEREVAAEIIAQMSVPGALPRKIENTFPGIANAATHTKPAMPSEHQSVFDVVDKVGDELAAAAQKFSSQRVAAEIVVDEFLVHEKAAKEKERTLLEQFAINTGEQSVTGKHLAEEHLAAEVAAAKFDSQRATVQRITIEETAAEKGFEEKAAVAQKAILEQAPNERNAVDEAERAAEKATLKKEAKLAVEREIAASVQRSAATAAVEATTVQCEREAMTFENLAAGRENSDLDKSDESQSKEKLPLENFTPKRQNTLGRSAHAAHTNAGQESMVLAEAIGEGDSKNPKTMSTLSSVAEKPKRLVAEEYGSWGRTRVWDQEEATEAAAEQASEPEKLGQYSPHLCHPTPRLIFSSVSSAESRIESMQPLEKAPASNENLQTEFAQDLGRGVSPGVVAISDESSMGNIESGSEQEYDDDSAAAFASKMVGDDIQSPVLTNNEETKFIPQDEVTSRNTRVYESVPTIPMPVKERENQSGAAHEEMNGKPQEARNETDNEAVIKDPLKIQRKTVDKEGMSRMREAKDSRGHNYHTDASKSSGPPNSSAQDVLNGGLVIAGVSTFLLFLTHTTLEFNGKG